MAASPEPVLSSAERAALADLEAVLAAQDPVLDQALRTGAPPVTPSFARLAVLLLGASVLIGAASLAGGVPVVLAVALSSMAAAIGVNLYRLRHPR